MISQEIFDRLNAQFGAVSDAGIVSKLDAPVDPSITVAPANLKAIALFLRDDEELQFEHCSCLSGVDLKGKFAVVYQLASLTKKHKITLRVEVLAENPSVPSVESVWKTANWHEREAFDMFGIVFTGHPDLRRILMPYDWEGHPLRKEYHVPEFYNGMRVPY
jgi:NADH-quinone oxidoreductase subunit C